MEREVCGRPGWAEVDRLAALDRYAILDSGREHAFDDVAILAAHILDAPIAVVNLIAADRQWFKAEVGIGTDTLPLDVSICRHAILERDVLVVPDLALDSRFEGNPLVHVVDGLRFYAGALLKTPDGLPLGTVCVLDRTPRAGGITAQQERALKTLADQTMSRFELRLSERTAKADRAEALEQARRLALISESSSLLLSAPDPAQVLKELFALVAGTIRIEFAFHYRCGDGALQLVAAAGVTPEQEVAASRLEFGQTVCGIVADTRLEAYFTGIQNSDYEHVQIAKFLGMQSYFSMPLLSGTELLGTLSFGRKDDAFSTGELEVLRTLAGQLSTALERRQSEADLRASEAELRFALKAGRFGAWSFDVASGALTTSEICRVNFGRDPGLPFTYADLHDAIHPDDRQRVQAAIQHSLAANVDYDIEYRILTPANAMRWVAIRAQPSYAADGSPLALAGVSMDITERKATEEALRTLNETLEQRVSERAAALEAAQEALRQSQKMEAMGQLTGGVAHDFNNLLTPIVGALDILQRRGIGGEREQRLISGAVQSADRAKVLVQRLLAFARRQPLQAAAVDVNRLVADMADLVASTTGPQVKVVVETDPDLPPAMADANQLEMALLNLSVNARDAMPDGGTLRISTRADSVEADRAGGLKRGRYVKISVADTGFGMDEDTLARAVEPFFSTKGIGRGTGLGLSMAHGLVSQLGGEMRLSSRPGLGTNIELWLPQSATGVEATATCAAAQPLPDVRGTVLLVDDEELVRISTADMLADLGYHVVEADSAEEALRLFDGGLRPAILITDHLMPGIAGTELARLLLARSDALSVLVISGYADSEGIDPGLPRLTKPFRNDELAAALSAFR